MKKLSNILVTLGVTIFLLSFGMKSEAVGQCPSGASYTTVDFVINGCTWRATICYECPLTTGPMWFGVAKLDLLSSGSCDTYLDALDSISNRLEYDFVYLVALCTSMIPPCIESSIEVYSRKYICWNLFNDSGNVSLEACSYSEYCVQEYELCWDMMPIYTKIGTPYLSGIPDCLEGEYPDEDPPSGHSSECFPLNFPCE